MKKDDDFTLLKVWVLLLLLLLLAVQLEMVEKCLFSKLVAVLLLEESKREDMEAAIGERLERIRRATEMEVAMTILLFFVKIVKL